MIAKKHLKGIAPATLAVLAGFIAGFAVHIALTRPDADKARTTNAQTVVAQTEIPAPASLHSIQRLDTVLLPLLKDTLAIPSSIGITPGGGGGITIVDDAIIIVDLQGAFFKVDFKSDETRKLDLPPPPNHAKEFNEFGPRPKIVNGFTVNTGFRVHDVESRKESEGVRLFVSYEKFLPELKTTALAVSAILVSEKGFDPLGEWEDLYQGQPLLHTEWYSGGAGGSRLLVTGDTLYVAAGDYNQDNVFMKSAFEAQNPQSDFGKIFSINLKTKDKTLVSMGHRVPQGLTITSNGTIYATEHGPKGGDLLTKIVSGTNYGWPVRTLGTHYLTYDWPNRIYDTGEVKFDKPLFAWVPSIGASNLIEVTNFHPAWKHDLLVESLVSQTLYRLRRDNEDRIVYSEPILIGERLRDIASLADGTLVLWTDQAHLIFLTVDTDRLAANVRTIGP